MFFFHFRQVTDQNLMHRYLYRIIVAIDTNFRLKNLRRPSTLDPGLHTGWTYFVANAPYLEHIMKYPKQKDVSYIIILRQPSNY